MAEIVYVVVNEAMPGLVKIGKTNGDLGLRIRGLYGTGVPLPFELFYACEVPNAAFVEKSASRGLWRPQSQQVAGVLSSGPRAG